MISALVGHLVGDFLLQTSWMANKKKKEWIACSVHCTVWAICVLAFSQWPVWLFIPLFITHFAQDGTRLVEWWMDVTGSNGFRTGAFAPWSVVVVDNVWHILTLWILWKLFV
jgi:hypothetical protein